VSRRPDVRGHKSDVELAVQCSNASLSAVALAKAETF
jgi:hypothetical protein